MGRPPIYIPAPYSGFALDSQSVLERMLNPLYRLRFRITMIKAFNSINKQRAAHGLAPATYQEPWAGGRVVLSTTAFGIEHARPMPPLFNFVGAVMPRESEPLGKSLRAWVKGTSTVLVNMDPECPLSPLHAKAIVDGLSQLPQRTLWVIDESQHRALPPQLPPAVKFRLGTSTSPLAVLRESSVRVFVSSCTWTSAAEALYFGKAILCIPFDSNAMAVAQRLRHAGVARVLLPRTITAEQVKAGVQSLQESESARRASEHLGKLLRAAGGLDAAVSLVESTLALGTADLRLLSSKQPWYQFMAADVFAIYVAILVLTTSVLRTLFSAFVVLFTVPVDTCGLQRKED